MRSGNSQHSSELRLPSCTLRHYGKMHGERGMSDAITHSVTHSLIHRPLLPMSASVPGCLPAWYPTIDRLRAIDARGTRTQPVTAAGSTAAALSTSLRLLGDVRLSRQRLSSAPGPS